MRGIQRNRIDRVPTETRFVDNFLVFQTQGAHFGTVVSTSLDMVPPDVFNSMYKTSEDGIDGF
jgi:hypothetical protein